MRQDTSFIGLRLVTSDDIMKITLDKFFNDINSYQLILLNLVAAQQGLRNKNLLNTRSIKITYTFYITVIKFYFYIIIQHNNNNIKNTEPTYFLLNISKKKNWQIFSVCTTWHKIVRILNCF